MVESVAQRVEEGGSMRRWRMPGGGAAPGLLQRMEAGRTEGVDAFERRMVGMGVMEADARDALQSLNHSIVEYSFIRSFE